MTKELLLYYIGFGTVIVVFAALMSMYFYNTKMDKSKKAVISLVNRKLKSYALLRNFKVYKDVTLNIDGHKYYAENIMLGYFGILIVCSLNHMGEYYGGLTADKLSLVKKQINKTQIDNPYKQAANTANGLRSLLFKNKIYKTSIETIMVYCADGKNSGMFIPHNGEIIHIGKLSSYLNKVGIVSHCSLGRKNL